MIEHVNNSNANTILHEKCFPVSTGITNSHMDFKLQTTNYSGRTIFQCTQAH